MQPAPDIIAEWMTTAILGIPLKTVTSMAKG